MISMIFMYKTWGSTKSWRHLRIPMSVTKQKLLSWMKSPPNQQGLAVMKNASSLKANSFSQRCPPMLSGTFQIHTNSSLLLLSFRFITALIFMLFCCLFFFISATAWPVSSLSGSQVERVLLAGEAIFRALSRCPWTRHGGPKYSGSCQSSSLPPRAQWFMYWLHVAGV